MLAINSKFLSLYNTLNEDIILKLDKAVLYNNVKALKDALALIASINPKL
jgi:hypothetical protein